VVISRRALATVGVYLAIALISVLHYLASPYAYQLHDIYRRLYYLPIIVAAFVHGWRGALIAALVVSAAYVPHAFGHISHDPATPTQKTAEILLYFAVGLTTGTLVSRLERSQRDLQESLAQLRSAEDQLVRAAKLAAVGTLSAGLAHEIRNPLASIKGSAEFLADDFPEGHPKRGLLRVLVEESDRLNQVLTRFLTFARPRPLDRREFDLRPELDALSALLQGHDAARSVSLRFDVRPDVARIRGDPEQLRQVLLNVILNACQAAGEGGSVDVRCTTADGSCRLEVHDSGPGFSAEAAEDAFTPFYTTKAHGTGLGLAISHRIVDSHGGRITLRNHERGGAVVSIELPLGGSDA